MTLENLLPFKEKRRVTAIEILDAHSGWMTTAQLAEKLDASIRVVKDDLDFFRKHENILTIDTSTRGIKLQFNKENGRRTLYQILLKDLPVLRLFEIVFFDDNLSVQELAKQLDVSPSSVYRMAITINDVLNKKYNLNYSTNPNKISGSEEKIRFFYYMYFNEKYTKYNLPFKEHVNYSAVMDLLNYLFHYFKMPDDASLFRSFELISSINLVRYRQGYRIDTSAIHNNLDELVINYAEFIKQFDIFQEKTNINVDDDMINQVFTPFIHDNFTLTYPRLIEKTKTNLRIRIEVDHIETFIKDVASEFNLPLHNLNELLLGMHNSKHFELYDFKSDYILLNETDIFSRYVQQLFPTFHKEIREKIIKLRKLFNHSVNDNGINYTLFKLITNWDGLVPILYNKYHRIPVLIMSDNHLGHSNMISDILKFHFSDQLDITIDHSLVLDFDKLTPSEYEIIITNFTIPNGRYLPNSIYIENIPDTKDIEKIRNQIKEIHNHKQNE